MDERVQAALALTAEWLSARQKDEGCWLPEKRLFNEPEEYSSEIISTSQAANALLLCNRSDKMSNLRAALNFCCNHALESSAPVAWFAWKLLTLRLSDAVSNGKEIRYLERELVKRQDAKGYWAVFPVTLNATNFMVLNALGNGHPDVTEKSLAWFRRSQLKSGGWSRDGQGKLSEPPATGTVAVTMIMLGENPENPALRKAAAFLEKSQLTDGGWKTTRIKEAGAYPTAFATLALMLLSKNPFNERVQKGVDYLLKIQNKDGGWPFAAGHASQLYTTYYAVHTLAFWQHLHDEWDRPEIKELRDKLGLQETAVWLYRRFPSHLKERFEKLLVRGMLNTKALGSSKDAIRRRQDILLALSEGGPGDTAEVIDRLKLRPEYEHLSKKSHITQIKADLDYLVDINLAGLVRRRYSVVKDFMRN